MNTSDTHYTAHYFRTNPQNVIRVSNENILVRNVMWTKTVGQTR
jgi:hypothetical protein